jgi:ATP-dependent Lon protease
MVAKGEFGIVFFSGKQIQNSGCTAADIKLLKRYEDDRMDILVQGNQRFRIEHLIETKPYLQAKVVFFDDDMEFGARENELWAKKGVALLKELSTVTGQIEESSLTEKLDYKDLSFLICAGGGFTLEEKQRFLEMTSTSARLKKSVDSLQQTLERMHLTRKIKSIIGGNGDLPESLQHRFKKAP